LMGRRDRIPPESWKSASCECCVLSGRVLCVGLVVRPEISYFSFKWTFITSCHLHISTESKLLAVCILLGRGSLIFVLMRFMHGDGTGDRGQVQRHVPLAGGVFWPMIFGW
jgi:hypothetical protein